jgi:PiT family inorganic phosphate transporter
MSILILVIILALVFDIVNGFHDAANSIATIVSTGVLTPKYAVLWAAFFNFIAYFIFGLHIANTVARGIVHIEIVTLKVLAVALIAAITWNMVTWWFAIPTSSSHTLIGGFIGAAVARAGFHAVFYS